MLLVGFDADEIGRFAEGFTRRGCAPTLASSAGQVVQLIGDEQFDLVVCGRSLATDDLGTVISRIERTGAMLLIVGAHDVAAMGNGHPDHLTIPPTSTVGEVTMAGIALLAQRGGHRRHSHLRFGDFDLDPDRRKAWLHGERLELTKYQFRLLAALIGCEGAVVSHEELDKLMFDSYPVDNGERVAAHVRRLRKKIEDDPAHPSRLLTVRGEGYRLADGE